MENSTGDFDPNDYDEDDEIERLNNEEGGYVDVNTQAPIKHPRTVSPNTISQYMGFVKSIRKSFLRSSLDVSRSEDVQPTELVEHLYSKASLYRPKTFINYRCGLLYWLSTLPASAEVLHAQLLLQVGFPKSGYKAPRQGAKPATLYSSRSSRKRTFRRRDFDKMIAELNKRVAAGARDKRMRNRANELLLWVQAGLASGLRPCEWETARWQNKTKGELLVNVAKTKWDVPALPSLAGTPKKEPQTRVVEIHEEDRIWVEQHLQAVGRYLRKGGNFKDYYNNNRMYLWAVCRELFPEREQVPFTLYTLRGQFSANRKKYKTLKDVAREMGCSPHTSGTYYGKPSSAHGSAIAMKPTRPQPIKFNFTRKQSASKQ